MSPAGCKQSLRNTRLCFFERAGCCRKGANCTFAHAAHDVQERPDLAQTSLCLSYLRGKSCLKGAECVYAHGNHELRVPNPAGRQPANDDRTRISFDSGAVERPMNKDGSVQLLPTFDVPIKPPGNFSPKAAMQAESAAKSTVNPSAARDCATSGFNSAFVLVFLNSLSSRRVPNGCMDGMDPAMRQQLIATMGSGGAASRCAGGTPGGGTGGMGGVASSNVWPSDDMIYQTNRIVEEMLKSASPDHYDD